MLLIADVAIWWLTQCLLSRSPPCSALRSCAPGPFGCYVSLYHWPFRVQFLPNSVLASHPLGLHYTSSFRFQTLPDSHPLPNQVSYYSALGLYLYFIAFISVLKLFRYLHNYLNKVLSFLMGCKPHDWRNQFAWRVK